MKAMLVLCLAAAVYARPNPGFAYTIADPTNLALNYAIAPSVYSVAHQPLVYAHHTPLVYAAPLGCRNNEGKRVACIGEPELKGETLDEVPSTPVEAPVETPVVAPVVPPVVAPAETPAVEVPAPIDAAPAGTETKIISLKKRDAQILLNTATNLVNPLVYAHQQVAPIAHIAPAVYKSCINNQGSVVPCSQLTQVAPIAFSTFPQVPLLPLATVEKKAEEIKPEEAKVEETIVSVEKREAEPQILINSLLHPTSYIAHSPIVQLGGCRNSVGALVPCA